MFWLADGRLLTVSSHGRQRKKEALSFFLYVGPIKGPHLNLIIIALKVRASTYEFERGRAKFVSSNELLNTYPSTDHQTDQDIEHFHCALRLLNTLFQSMSYPLRHNHLLTFVTIKLILLALELYVNGTIHYELYCVWLTYSTQYF